MQKTYMMGKKGKCANALENRNISFNDSKSGLMKFE